MTNKIEYSIVIPVYNGNKYLNELYNRISSTFKNTKDGYEIIFVDDGSKDNSWKVLEDIKKNDEQIKIIKLSKNFGQHNATLCGLRNSEGEYIITLDQDLQHPPEEIHKLINKIKKGYSLVYGDYNSKKHNWFRNIGSRLTNKIISDITKTKNSLTSFRIIKKEIVNQIIKCENPVVIIDILFSEVISSKEIGFCKVSHLKNAFNESNYGFIKLLKVSLNMTFNHTISLLRIASVLGILISLFSFTMGIFYLIKFLVIGTSAEGFTAIILSILFFSGIILLVLGIIGEYLTRIYLIINKKPQYIVRRKLGLNCS